MYNNDDYDNERAWYVIQSYAGMEYAAKRNLERRIVSMNMEDYIFNVLIPEEIHYELKTNGEKNSPASISFVPSVAGLIIAGEVIKDIIRR